MIFTFQQDTLNTFSMVNHDKGENMPETKTDNIKNCTSLLVKRAKEL